MQRVLTFSPCLGLSRQAKTSGYTVVLSDRGSTIDCTSGTFTLAFDPAATLGSGFHIAVYNSGSGVVTLNPNGAETIRTYLGAAATLALNQGQGVVVLCDGSNFDVIASTGIAGAFAGVLPAINGGTGNANTGTLTFTSGVVDVTSGGTGLANPSGGLSFDSFINLVNSGTIDFGGFITTVPASGTFAIQENANAFTAAVSVIDGNFSLIGSGDPTKTMRFEVDAQSTGADLTLNTGAQTADRSLTVPVLTGNATLAVLSETQTFTGAKTMTGGLTVSTTAITVTDVDLVLSGTTGTKIGTATTQKLSFYNATPIVRPTGDLITAITNLGLVGSPTISATALTGIVPSTNGGTGVNNAGTITNASNTTITGGGTIALGGFTLTVPATGTAALLAVANTFTLANTFSATTAASSSTTGTVIIGNGTAATTVGIGGGILNAGTRVVGPSLRTTDTLYAYQSGVGIGGGAVSPLIQHNGTDANAGVGTARWSANANGSRWILGKSRGAAVGTLGVVSNNDYIGLISFSGDDGTVFQEAARISGEVDGTPGANDMPGRLKFWTTPDGTVTPVLAMTIDALQVVSVQTTTDSTSSSTGSVITSGGLNVAKNIFGRQGQIEASTSIATAAGTTTLTISSTIWQIFTGSTTQTCNLPAANVGGAGFSPRYVIKNESSGNVTVARAGSDTIFTTSSVTSVVLTTGQTLFLCGNGSTKWSGFVV